MKKTLSEMFKALSLLKKDYPLLKTVCVADAVSIALIPYINLVFFARILRMLMTGAFDRAISNAVAMIGLTLFFSLVHRTAGRKMEAWKPTMQESVSRQLSDKAYVMEYDNLEKTETLDRIRSAEYLVMGSGGFDYLASTFTQMISALVSLLCAILFIVRLFVLSADVFRFNDPWFWGLITGFALMMACGAYVAKKSGESAKQLMEDNAHGNAVGGYLIDAGLRTSYKKDMLVYNMSRLVEDRFGEYRRETFPAYIHYSRRNGRLMALMALVSNLYAAFGYLFVGMRALDGAIPVSDVLLYAGALQRLTSASEQLVRAYMNIESHTSYLLSFYDFIHQEPMHYTGTLPVEKRTDCDYEIAFHDVSFSYPGREERVLDHVNLTFKVGEKLALVGRNGAGKSTIVKLLCRLYEPTEGEITLNGIDIRKYDYAEYTSVFAPVFQDFKLFALPVRENVTCGEETPHPSAETPHPSPAGTPSPRGEGNVSEGKVLAGTSDARLWEALEKAGIADRVREMKDGADTLLYHDNGEGVDVSGGEAQRLAIARAWYKDAPFVILDEPTAALDPLTEAEIYENFNDLIGDKTAIYISHRMSSCKFCDEIVVLKEGRIEERGTHESLLSAGGEYATLYNTQAKYYNAGAA